MSGRRVWKNLNTHTHTHTHTQNLGEKGEKVNSAKLHVSPASFQTVRMSSLSSGCSPGPRGDNDFSGNQRTHFGEGVTFREREPGSLKKESLGGDGAFISSPVYSSINALACFFQSHLSPVSEFLY